MPRVLLGAARTRPARPSGSRFARMSPPIRFAHLRCIFGLLQRGYGARAPCQLPPLQCIQWLKICLGLAHRPVFCRGPLCRAAIIVPAPREASGGVSRSLLLGSELKSSKPVLPRPLRRPHSTRSTRSNQTPPPAALFLPSAPKIHRAQSLLHLALFTLFD